MIISRILYDFKYPVKNFVASFYPNNKLPPYNIHQAYHSCLSRHELIIRETAKEFFVHLTMQL